MFNFVERADLEVITIVPRLGEKNLGFGSARCTEGSVVITDLIVDPSKRKQGIGTEMVQKMEEWAQACDTEQITMTIASNPRELEIDGRRELLDFLINRGYVLSPPGEVRKSLNLNLSLEVK